MSQSPRDQADSTRASEAARPLTTRLLARTRILVIEDDRTTRWIYRRVLEAAGLEVEEAANGLEGLRRFRSRPADIVICDVFMPEMDGLETITALKREFPSIVVFAVSGGGLGGRLHLLRTAKVLGATRSFAKPLDFRELIGAVNSVRQDAC